MKKRWDLGQWNNNLRILQGIKTKYGLEYADCIACQEVPSPPQKRCVLDMTLNCI